MKQIIIQLPEDLFSDTNFLGVGEKLSDIITQLLSIEERISTIEKRIVNIGHTYPTQQDTQPVKNTQVSDKEKIARSLIEGFGLFD